MTVKRDVYSFIVNGKESRILSQIGAEAGGWQQNVDTVH